MDLDEFEEGGAEYRFLLQPVRDLASNWDIDISNYLEEYVRKLIGDSETCDLINEHGRRKIFNFAEAAVLIHGSTNIYIKKVEYVYQLAANFFDQLKEDKQKKRRKEGGGADDDGGSDDDGENHVYKNPFLHPEKRRSKLESMKNVLSKLSKKRPCLPLVPIAFTPLADFEKTDVPLYNRLNSKEVIGKKDDFKINICHIHEAVALLDLKNAELIDRFTSFNDENQPEYGPPVFKDPKQEFIAVEAHRNATGGLEEYGHADISVMDAFIEPSEVAISYVSGPEDIASIDNHQPKFSSMGFAGPNEEDVPMVDETNPAVDNAVFEEELLDPFEEKSEKSKPFKINKKCCTIAAKQVKMRDHRIAKECQAKGVANIPSVKNYIDSRMYRRKIKKRSFAFAQFNSYLMDQALLALNDLIYEEEKRRTEIKKKREIEAKKALREARISQRRSRSRRNPTASIDMVVRNYGDSGHEEPQYEDVADELGADEIIDDNEPEQPEEFHQLGDFLHVDDLEDSLRVTNLYADGSHNFGVDRNRAHFSSFGYATQNIYDDTIFPDVAYPDELPPRPVSQMEYDELVAYHLRKYWSTAEEATSKFCERVQKWEEKMTPLLEEEYAHREFDTRQYGDELMEAFQNKLGTIIDFGSVIKNSVDYDMSRYLLVSLIMTNTQNLQVVNTGEQNVNEACRDNLKLKLLKLERHHQVFEEEQLLVSGKNSA